MAKRVYFAFHYQDVIDFRANVVRNHNFLGGIEKAGYYDASIWESAKKESPLAVKRMINSELYNTSVTAVLIGSQTYARPWVRYEIMKSVERGNVVLGVHINSIADKNKLTKTLGPNPFDYLGLHVSQDGKKGVPTEWDGQKWRVYSQVSQFSLNQQLAVRCGKNCQLSTWFRTYDWIANHGYNSFTSWIS